MAEREGFEPPMEFPPYLLSRQTPSAELGHLSEKFITGARVADNSMWGPCRFAPNAPTPLDRTGKARSSLIGKADGASPSTLAFARWLKQLQGIRCPAMPSERKKIFKNLF